MHRLIDQNAFAGSGNDLLKVLRPADAALLYPLLEPWLGSPGEIIFEPGDAVRSVYFPCGPSAVSHLVVLHDATVTETALIGREGAVGPTAGTLCPPAYTRTQVRIPGPFLRIGLADLEAAKRKSEALTNLFAAYADCITAQIFQSVACNATHSIEQRTAKCLVSALERSSRTSVRLTQAQLAAMAAVGRQYINPVLQAFKKDGILELRRGELKIRDINALRDIDCGCNSKIRAHFGKALSGVYPDEAERPTRREVEVEGVNWAGARRGATSPLLQCRVR